MKILHVIPTVAAGYGGPSQAIFEMCRALRGQGIDVLIATTDGDVKGRLEVRLEEELEHNGVRTIFFKRVWGSRFGYSPALKRWLDSNVDRFDAVHIHAVFSHPCLAAARSCQRRSPGPARRSQASCTSAVG